MTDLEQLAEIIAGNSAHDAHINGWGSMWLYDDPTQLAQAILDAGWVPLKDKVWV